MGERRAFEINARKIEEAEVLAREIKALARFGFEKRFRQRPGGEIGAKGRLASTTRGQDTHSPNAGRRIGAGCSCLEQHWLPRRSFHVVMLERRG
jgi:hypothetical protein